jgi:hypothetical protein
MGIPSSGTIAVDDQGVSSFNVRGKMLWRIQWADVVRICTYKDDVFVYDTICAGFLVNGQDRYVCCDEHYEGWKELHDELHRRYSVKLEDWWPGVAFPAFVENFTVIWERSNG